MTYYLLDGIGSATMGTRVNVFLSHDLLRFDDAAATLARLQSAVPAALAVEDYWRSVDPRSARPDRTTYPHWETEILTGEDPRHYYSGPGSLFLSVTPAAALLHTGGRWRGFLSIEPLRKVHLTAFRAIARALGSRHLAICHDGSHLIEEFEANGTQATSIARLRSALGLPQHSVGDVAASVTAEAERKVPNVWYLDVFT